MFWCSMLMLMSSVASLARAAPPKDPTQKRRAVVKLREVLQAEPTIKEVQTAALKYYRLEPSRINALTASARIKALLPEVDFGFDNTVGNNFTTTQDILFATSPYKEKTQENQGQLVFHMRAVWDLSRLAFNSEELDIKSLNSLQETLLREVTTLYFSRRRLVATLILSPPQDDEEAIAQQLRVEELTATIDAFTGGMFAPRAWDANFIE
jgi:hypothetical protein